MKISIKRRLISLLLAFLMVLTLAPSAGADSTTTDPDTGDTSTTEPGDGGTTTPPGGGLDNLELRGDGLKSAEEAEADYEITLEPNATPGVGGIPITAVPTPDSDPNLSISWASADPEIVGVSENQSNTKNRSAFVYGKKPGKAIVTVKATLGESSITKTIEATVSGIRAEQSLINGITVAENQSVILKLGTDYTLFGKLETTNEKITASVIDSKPNVKPSVSSDGRTVMVEGREAGQATVALQIGQYKIEFSVTVTSSEEIIPWTDGCSAAKPLKFSALEEKIAAKFTEMFPGGTFSSIIGLNVPTSQGTLYLGYKSPEDTGAGVGGSVTYYYHTGARGPYIKDITFVPNASFAGEKAEITFTGQGTSSDGSTRSFKGKIEVTLTQEKSDLTVSTKRDTPLKLSASLFSRACQEQVGSPLSYVIFTLPPANQGKLYTGYKNEWDYAAAVSASERYSQRQIDDITFVPAQGFVGKVTVSYAGYSVSGSKYSGQLVIQVQQGVDDAITYNDNGAGSVGFARADFDSFCENATGRLLGSISFTPPAASQGVLYYNWNGVRGTAVAAGNSYSAVQIDRLTFVAAEGFDGVVRIPFNGVDRAGETFSGTVEVHIKSADAGNGDISYTCAPGESVKLALSDFANLCQTLTGQRLHYISFQTLPDFNRGSLFHNRTSAGSMGTRVTTTTKYFNSAAPYISNLSFWAKEGFSGGVEIPFTGCAVSGETFTGVLYISSGEGAGSGSAGAVRYTVTGGDGVTFSGQDFDTACRQATNAALSYVKFDLPSSGQGILYYDYRKSNAPRALDPSTQLFRSGEVSVDKVTFVPASGFAGTAYVPFTATSINGREYRGNVEITVRSPAALGGLIRYETGGAPVYFAASDVLAASGGQPETLRLTGLPDAKQGRVYYGYDGPTRYSWEGNTSTVYSLYGDPSVSELAFVPKAGYAGTVEIPYTASNQDGSTYSGTIRITVSAPAASENFDDMGKYAGAYNAAVDYLYSMGVVNGTGARRYEPTASIRRGDFCLMLSRAFEFNVGSTTQGFSDVPAGAYYAQAVNQMYAIGVVEGVGGGKFSPSASITRQDAALMVQRALRQAGIDAPDGNAAALAAYSDRGRVASYAQGAVGGLAQQGIFPLSSSGRLLPRENLTWADMALLLHRAMTQ